MNKFAVIVEKASDCQYYEALLKEYKDLMEDPMLSVVVGFMEQSVLKDTSVWIPMFNVADLMSFDGTVMTTSQEINDAVSQFLKSPAVVLSSPEEMINLLKGKHA